LLQAVVAVLGMEEAVELVDIEQPQGFLSPLVLIMP